MANPEHLAILMNALEKDNIRLWNQWRRSNPSFRPDLSGANLNDTYLRDINLSDVNLSGTTLNRATLKGANLDRADLKDANLSYSNLSGANLKEANLSNAELWGAGLGVTNLSGANLSNAILIDASLENASLVGTNLSNAQLSDTNMVRSILIDATLKGALLSGANLWGAQLNGATLSHADLYHSDLTNATLIGTILNKTKLSDANLTCANLTDTDLTDSTCNKTIFADVDLSMVKGLETINHSNRSYIDFHTLQRSGGNIPEIFLRGCGLSDTYITYVRSLIGSPIDFYSCFISYSHEDKSFARRVHDTLQGRGIRCWFDEKQMNVGDDIYEEIDRGIRYWDKVLLCCSEHSLTSGWVDSEINRAFEKERQLFKERKRKVKSLIPLNLDGYLFSDDFESGKKSDLHSRIAADFRGWEHDNAIFETQIERVIKALKTDGGKEIPPESKL